MKDMLWQLWDQIVWKWIELTTHSHKFIISGMAIYKGELIEMEYGIPLTAWWYKCKCGCEICELDESGIRLLQRGATFANVAEDNRI